MKSWKSMALIMLTITVLFNVLLMREMPDSSAGSIGSDRKTTTDGSQRRGETISRRLGAAESRGATTMSTQGLLKRWILRGKSAPEQRATSSSSQPRNTVANDSTKKDQSGEEKYLSHPHFAGRSPVASDTAQSAQSSQDPLVDDSAKQGDQHLSISSQGLPEGEGTAASGAPNASALNAELTQALIERPARLESLSEAFAQRQEIIAAVAETNGSADAMVVSEALPLAVPVSKTLDITKASSSTEEQPEVQQQAQQQALLDVQERPRAPLDEGNTLLLALRK